MPDLVQPPGGRLFLPFFPRSVRNLPLFIFGDATADGGKLGNAILQTGNPSGIELRICVGGVIRFQTDWDVFRCANLAGSLICNL